MGVVAERKRFTVDEYHKLARAGVLGEGDRIELVEGELIQTPPIGSVHAGLVGRLDRAFQAHVPQGFVVWIQNPLTFPPASELQPDLVLLRQRSDEYLNSLPTASDVLQFQFRYESEQGQLRGVQAACLDRRWMDWNSVALAWFRRCAAWLSLVAAT